MTAGSGLGFLARARFEERLKDERDRTLKDQIIAKAPLIGAILGAGAGATLGARNIVKKIDEYGGYVGNLDRWYMGMPKVASLKPSVHLKDHQQRAVDKLDENNGSLMVAHATGSGKTLTGIAAFEQLKKDGKAKRALVVVPASLRENFANSGVKKFTNSSVAMYGPKGESKSLNVDQPSKADYNVVSYELFREHGDALIKNTGADTLIMDEIHHVRGDTGVTYNHIRDLRPQFKQAITLTGSVVNNEPSDVVPLMDITFGPTGHKLVSRPFFDKLFVNKEAITKGLIWGKKVYIEKNIKNKDALARYLGKKIDFVSHEDLEKEMPRKDQDDIVVPMTPEQKQLYNFSLSSVDPLTRWKIRNNIPVGQREAMDAFSKLLQARQISTDPAIMDKKLEGKNPLEYSPKIRAIVDDLKTHLREKADNRVVVYGNLIRGQMDAVEKGLNHEKVPYEKFYGTGQEGVTAKTRVKAIENFQDPKHPTRVLLISGAGSEGLDLKGATMLQMVEGHYNPEKIHQAESRIRRMGAFEGKPEAERKVTIKRYYAKPVPISSMDKVLSGAGKLIGGGGDEGVDKWIYTIAKRKDDLNKQFREVLQKTAASDDEIKDVLANAAEKFGPVKGHLTAIPASKHADKSIDGLLKNFRDESVARAKSVKAELRSLDRKAEAEFKNFEINTNKWRKADSVWQKSKPKVPLGVEEYMADVLGHQVVGGVFSALAGIPSRFIAGRIDKGVDKEIEAGIKQKLLDQGFESLTQKKHYSKILAESKIDEKVLDATFGVEQLTSGLGALASINPGLMKPVIKPMQKGMTAFIKKFKPNISLEKNPKLFIATAVAPYAITGMIGGAGVPILTSKLREQILKHSIGDQGDLGIGIQRYTDKLRKKMESKYKGSKSFVQEYETKKEFGIDTIL